MTGPPGAPTHWTRTMFAPSRPEDLTVAIDGAHDLMNRLVTARYRHPRTDLISHGATIAPRGGLSRDEVVTLAFGMWWAGIENTAHLISRSALDLIHPAADHRRQRPVDRHLIEELLAGQGPVLTAARRFARHDLTIAGQLIPAGDTVLLTLTTTGPPRTDRVRHLAFGHGPHRCPGAALARLELRAAFTALQHHLPYCTLTVPHHLLPHRTSHRLAGLLALPLTAW
ncbi:cytochrome P450 [Streptomyces violascens]|uniref:cytochrome P450 n=1 Tax=Streptomyces violascens TaxID=67381 RepID=UPI0036557B92